MSKLYIIVPHQCLLDVCATFLLCFLSVNHTLKLTKRGRVWPILKKVRRLEGLNDER